MNKAILYHIIFWVVYLSLWSARDLVYHPIYWHNWNLNFMLTITIMPLVYFNAFCLIPRLLFRRRWVMYGVAICAALYFFSYLRFKVTALLFLYLFKSDLPVALSGINGMIVAVSESLVVIMITMALFLIREWNTKERYTRELERKNLESELSVLKGQLQPHFLFNNLNTIYFLMESDPQLAKEVMIGLSELLSHQLYEAKKDKVLLKNEIESLQHYIKIQEVRQIDFLKLEYELPEAFNGLMIAPMILLTFVENAFKHGQREEGYYIKIFGELKDNELHFKVKNSIGDAIETGIGGVGLENVRRRLELVYPQKHSLAIEKTEKHYTVDLQLTLDDHE